MNALLKLTLLTALCSIHYAQATMLPFLEHGYMSNGNMDIVSPPFGGTLLASMTSTGTGTVSVEGYWTNAHDAPGVRHPTGMFYEGSITGTLTSAVYQVGANLDFYYQFTNDKSSHGNFAALFGSDFVGLGKSTVDVYQTKNATGPFVPGVMPFGTTQRLNFYEADGVTVASNSLVSIFAVDTTLSPGNASLTEIVRTAGIDAYSEGTFVGYVDDISGHMSTKPYALFTGYVPWFEPVVPAIPEPETYALLLTGLGVIGAVGRRRKASQV
jgi:hypothetical protein